jgi:hypothetical protein
MLTGYVKPLTLSPYWHGLRVGGTGSGRVPSTDIRDHGAGVGMGEIAAWEASPQRSSTTSPVMISAGVEGMFAAAIAGGASAVPLRVHSAFP